jgi:hypothetical protein
LDANGRLVPLLPSFIRVGAVLGPAFMGAVRAIIIPPLYM